MRLQHIEKEEKNYVKRTLTFENIILLLFSSGNARRIIKIDENKILFQFRFFANNQNLVKYYIETSYPL